MSPVPPADQRPKRPAVAAIIVVGHVTLAVPVLRVLFAAVTGPTVSAANAISSVLVLLGLPLAAIGLYGLASRSTGNDDARPSQAWLRPPLAYLAVALVLFIAGGLAAR